jgi:LUD domain
VNPQPAGLEELRGAFTVGRMTAHESTDIAATLPVDESFAAPAPTDLLERAAAALRAAGFTVHLADTISDSRRIMNEILPRDRAVFTSTSETLRESGLTEDIDQSGQFKSVRAEQRDWDVRARADDLRRTRSAPDVVVGSVHAVTGDGLLVTASASGSQLPAYAFGAEQAFWVVGAQKVVPDLETAFRRIETYSLPKEDARMQKEFGQGSAISKILIIGREIMPDRATVILVREAIGF